MIRFFFFGLLICFSCVSPNKLTISKLDLPFITMRRTACFGTCPQYTISIYDDGTINYEGKLFVSFMNRSKSCDSREIYVADINFDCN